MWCRYAFFEIKIASLCFYFCLLQVKELKAKVAELQPGQFLVLHGMPGAGKSVLAAEVVHDPEITLKVFFRFLNRRRLTIFSYYI